MKTDNDDSDANDEVTVIELSAVFYVLLHLVYVLGDIKKIASNSSTNNSIARQGLRGQ